MYYAVEDALTMAILRLTTPALDADVVEPQRTQSWEGSWWGEHAYAPPSAWGSTGRPA